MFHIFRINQHFEITLQLNSTNNTMIINTVDVQN